MNLLALCTRQPENELIAAECQQLTGGKPDEHGIALCQTVDLIPQAAYVHTGLRLLHQTATLDELVAQITANPFPNDDFVIEFQRLSAENPVRSQQAILAVANALSGYPNLDHPQHRFLLLARAEGFWFGEVTAKTTHSYHSHDEKPWHTSSSLSARLARALVNLAWPVQSIFDPCCGTGSILIEASMLGIATYGSDRSPKMVGMSRKNLAHFGYHAEVLRGDARQATRTTDAIITDLPYGRFCHAEPQEIRQILQQCAQLAPLGIFVTENDIGGWLYESGYATVETWHVPKRAEMSRIIHRAKIASPP
jgi:tRNA G10  N-methylase Trm11